MNLGFIIAHGAQRHHESAAVVRVFAGDQQQDRIAVAHVHLHIIDGKRLKPAHVGVEFIRFEQELTDIDITVAIRLHGCGQHRKGHVGAVLIDRIEVYRAVGLQKIHIGVLGQRTEHRAVLHVVAVHDQIHILRNQQVRSIQKQRSAVAVLAVEIVVQIIIVIVFTLHHGQGNFLADADVAHRFGVAGEQRLKGFLHGRRRFQRVYQRIRVRRSARRGAGRGHGGRGWRGGRRRRGNRRRFCRCDRFILRLLEDRIIHRHGECGRIHGGKLRCLRRPARVLLRVNL